MVRHSVLPVLLTRARAAHSTRSTAIMKRPQRAEQQPALPGGRHHAQRHAGAGNVWVALPKPVCAQGNWHAVPYRMRRQPGTAHCQWRLLLATRGAQQTYRHVPCRRGGGGSSQACSTRTGTTVLRLTHTGAAPGPHGTTRLNATMAAAPHGGGGRQRDHAAG